MFSLAFFEKDIVSFFVAGKKLYLISDSNNLPDFRPETSLIETFVFGVWNNNQLCVAVKTKGGATKQLLLLIAITIIID